LDGFRSSSSDVLISVMHSATFPLDDSTPNLFIVNLKNTSITPDEPRVITVEFDSEALYGWSPVESLNLESLNS